MCRKQSKESIMLDISMDLYSILDNTTGKEEIRNIIDKHDDERRRLKREKEEEYLKRFDKALEKRGVGDKDVSEVYRLLTEYKHFLIRENRKEDRFERMDDENRVGIKGYLEDKMEEAREYNGTLQEMIISDR